MAHKRTSIRNNVTTALTGLTTTGSNVFESRIYPNELSKLPLLNIYSNTETSELSSIGKIERNLEIQVEGFAKATSNIDETLDTIAKEVEIALATDLGTMRIAAQMIDMPVAKIMSGLFKQLKDVKKKERARFGVRLGIAAENWISRSHAQSRFFGEVVGPNLSILASDSVLRATGLSSWTQGARQVFGIEFLGHLGDLKNTKFNELPAHTRDTLKKYEITEDRWNIIRKTEMEVYKGVDFVRPLNIEARDDLAPGLGREISVALQTLIHNETNRGIPQATIRSQITLKGNAKRGTFSGEMINSSAQFKSFPVSIMQGNLLR